VQRLALQLRVHRSHDFGVPVSNVEDAEAAQAIDVLAAVDVGENVSGVGPLDRRIERALCAALAVFEETGIDVIAETVDGFLDDPSRLGAVDRPAVDDF